MVLTHVDLIEKVRRAPRPLQHRHSSHALTPSPPSYAHPTRTQLLQYNTLERRDGQASQ